MRMVASGRYAPVSVEERRPVSVEKIPVCVCFDEKRRTFLALRMEQEATFSQERGDYVL